MSDPIYSVIDWDRHFENNRSRTVENLRWVCVPNRHDGEGYSLLMEQDDAAELFAAWVLILQVASKCQARGTLVRDDGTPLTAKSLAIKTRGDRAWFEKALNFFTTKVKWMECHPTDTQLTGDCHPTDTHLTKKEGKEWKGGSEGAPAPDPLSELDSETLARQGKSLESIAARLALPAANFIEHGATVGLSPDQVRQWADSRVSNGWSTGKGKPLTPVTWPADMNNFASAFNQISQKQTHGKNHSNGSRNDQTANAGRSAAFADIGKLRPGV